MGVFCVNTKSLEFKDTAKRLNIHPNALEVYVHLFQNSVVANDYLEATDELPFPTDEQIMEYFSLGNKESGLKAIDTWAENYGATDGFVSINKVDEAINLYGKEAVHTYGDYNGNIVHRVSRPEIDNVKELKYLLLKLHIIDEDNNLLGISMDKFYERMDNLAIPVELYSLVEMNIIKKAAIDDNFSPENDDIYYENEEQQTKIITPIKDEYKGKLIFAQSGTGKTTIADNENVIDSDYIVAQILGVNTALATEAFRLLPKEAKDRVTKLYHDKINELVAEGKTVVTSSTAMMDKADVIIIHPNLETALEKTSRTDRTNRVVAKDYLLNILDKANLKKANANVIVLSKDLYLGDIVLKDTSFSITKTRVDNTPLIDIVELFMKNFGVSLELMEERGYSVDYIERVVKGFDDSEVIAGTGDLIAFMMQYNGEAKEIISQLAIQDGTATEAQLYISRKSGDTIINDRFYKSLNKEKYFKLLGEAITKELKYLYDYVKLNGVFDNNHTQEESVFKKLWNIIKEFFSKVTLNRELLNQINDFSSYVAANVIQNNAALITRSLRKPGDEDAGPVEKVDLIKALDEHPFEREILQKLNKKNIVLAGSAAIATQVSVFRPSENPLHDLDFQTPDNTSREQLEEIIVPMFPNLQHTNTIENEEYTTETYLMLDRPFSIRKLEGITGYIIEDLEGNTIGSFMHNDLHLKDGVNGKFLDFFTKLIHKYSPIEISYKDSSLKVANYRGAMLVKLEYSRLKDIFDFNRAIPADFEQRPSYRETVKEIDTYEEHEYPKVIQVNKDTRLVDLYNNSKREEKEVPISAIIDIIQENTLGKQVISLLKEISKTHSTKMLAGVKVELVSPQDSYSSADNVRSKFRNHRAYYNAKTHTIYVNVDSGYVQGDSASVLLHEVLHAITIDRILNNPEYKKELASILESYNRLVRFGETAYIGEHALEEFVADIWSNSTTINALKRMRAASTAKKSLWERIKEFFRQALFEGVSDKSLFALASATLYQLLERPVSSEGMTSADNYFESLNREIIYNAEQQEAIRQAGDYLSDPNATEDFFLITGPAGVGKTTIINEIIKNETKRTGRVPSIYVTAVANKAVRVLSSKIEAKHIRRATATALGLEMSRNLDAELEFRFPKKFEPSKVPIAESDIVIIDEASMLNTASLKAVMEVKKFFPDKKFIMLGDINLLEAIELGNSSDKIDVFSYENKKEARLLTRVRQGEGSPILNYSDEFRIDTINVGKYEKDAETDKKKATPDDTSRKSIITPQGAVIMYKDSSSRVNEEIVDSLVPMFKEALDTHNPNLIKICAIHKILVKRYNDLIYKRLHPEETNPLNPLHKGDLIMFYNQFGKTKNEDTGTTEPLFFNSDEFSVQEVHSAPTLYSIGISQEELVKLTKDKNAKLPNFYTQDIIVNKEGVPYNLRVICPLIDNLNALKAYKSYLYLKAQLIRDYDDRLLVLEIFRAIETDVAEINLGYAINVFKALGSTYDTVIVDAKDIRGLRVDDKKGKVKTVDGFTVSLKLKGMYTAITRASNITVVLRDRYETDTPILDLSAINSLINLGKQGKDVSSLLAAVVKTTPETIEKQGPVQKERRLERLSEQQSVAALEGIEKTPLLVEDEKWKAIFQEHDDKIEFIESSHDYFYYPLGKSHPESRIKMDTSVTSITNPVDRKPRSAADGLDWLDVSSKIGTSADRVVRDFFNGIDITARKYPNFTIELLKTLQRDLINFKKHLDKVIGQNGLVSYKVITNPFSVVGKITKLDGSVLTLGGTVDILIYDEAGFYYIYDIKTSRKLDLRGSDTLLHYTSQVNLYRECIEVMHPELKGQCGGLGILQLHTFYPTPKNLKAEGKIGNTKYTADTTGQLQADGIQVEFVDGYEAPHFIDGDVQKASIDDIKEAAPEQWYLDKRHKPVTVSALDTKKAGSTAAEDTAWTTSAANNKAKATKRLIEGRMVPLAALMREEYAGNQRDGITSSTTLDAIVNGERTATTRYSRINEFWKKVKEGDTVEFHDNGGRSILVKVTRAPHKLSPDLDVDEWSLKEGWSVDYFNDKVLPHVEAGEAYLMEYEYIPDSYAGPEVTNAPAKVRTTTPTAVTSGKEVTISYEKDVKNYRKGTPQKHKDTAYIFTENALAHNALEGEEPIGPPVSFIVTNVGKNRKPTDKVNQADIRTGIDGEKTPNAFGLIVKKYLQDELKSWVALEGCFKDTDEDFELFTQMNTAMFEELASSSYKKVVFPYQVALGKAALPKRFAEWLKGELESRFGIVTSLEKNKTFGYKGYGLRVSEVLKDNANIQKGEGNTPLFDDEGNPITKLGSSDGIFSASTGAYGQRTDENAAWSDITLQVADSFDSPGEKRTTKAAGDKAVKLNVSALSKDLTSIAIATANEIKEILSKKKISTPIKLNVAGAGIYGITDLGPIKNATQEDLNQGMTEFLQLLLDNGILISEIRSGGLTGMDEAGIVAALRLGIKYSVYAPNNWAFRTTKETFKSRYKDRVTEDLYRLNRDGTYEIMDEELFKERFSYPSASENKEPVSLIYKRIPEMAEIGTEEEYAEYLNTIFPQSVDKSVYWHGTNADFSEGFDTAVREQGSGAPETLTRNDFYLAKQAWTVLQYVNGVNRKGTDKNGFAHWNKLWWELREIMSNGRRQNNDWKNIVIGDATLRQEIPNKKGIFNRDKGGTNGKWLKERKADYGYEDKSDREFFEDIFGIEWNKDTFNTWIERNAEIFKALEDNQDGIYPVVIDVRNPIREAGQDTYYEENRGLFSLAEKEGNDAILGTDTDNEFNSDVAVVLNIGTSKEQMSKRVHVLGTKTDKRAFQAFVDKKHGRQTLLEYNENLNEQSESLISSMPEITPISEATPSGELYTDYEKELIREREALNALKDDKDSIFKPSELNDLAKACMMLVSDFVSDINSNMDHNEKWFKCLPDEKRREELIATDFTKMSRLEVMHKLGMSAYAVIQHYYFNAANNPNKENLRRSTRKKLMLINQNFKAFLEMGENTIARLEGITIDGLHRVVDESSSQVFEGEDLETIAEIKGSSVEHWLVSFRLVSAHASLSQLIKRTIGTLFDLDSEFKQKKNEFGIPIRMSESLAINQILMWTQGAQSLEDMVLILKGKEKQYPWVHQLIIKLGNSSLDETFKAQFWSNFRKYFQPYIIQYLKEIKDMEGKVIGSTLTNKVINQRTLEKQMLEDFQTLFRSILDEGTETTLYDTEGNIKKSILNAFESSVNALNRFLEDNKENLTAEADEDIKAAISNIYACVEVSLDDMTLDGLSDYNTVRDIRQHATYLLRGLKKGAKTKYYDLAEHHRNDLESLFKHVVDNGATTLESVSYEDGKLHYSYVVPSYLSNLVQKLKGNVDDYETFLENNYGKYGWFKQGAYWRNEWLRLLAENEEYRKEMQHAVVLTTRPVGATVSVGYRDKSPMLYAKSMLQNYFYGGKGSKWAYYRIPIMSNKPSEEYIRFLRYTSSEYKEDLADLLIEVAFQEIDRIATVRQRNADKRTVEIKNFDKNGSKFLFLDYLQPILEEYLAWKSKEENEDTIIEYTEDEFGNIDNERLLLGLMLELQIQGKVDMVNDSEFRNLLARTIEQEMAKKFEEYLQDMTNEGLLELDKNGNYIHLKDILMLDGMSVLENLENFFWNDTFAAINILQLTITDIAYYKNAEDLQKRLAQIHAPGLRGNAQAKWDGQVVTDGKTRTIYIADFDGVVSDAIENIKEVFERKAVELEKVNPKEAKQFRAQAKHIIEAFEDINVTDAQGYNSPTSYRKKAIAFGKWDDNLEKVYLSIRSGKYDARDLEVMMQPLKPFVYSNTTKQSVGRLGDLKVGMQNKNSEYLLLMMDAILQGDESAENPSKSKLAAIYQVMEESHYDENGNYKTDGIDTVQFNSTVKAGETGVIDLNKATTTLQAKEMLEQAIYNGGVKANGYNFDSVHVLEFEDYCILNEVPAHLDGLSIFGSQMRILAISDMPEVVNGVELFITLRGKRTSIREAKKQYMEAIATNIYESLDELCRLFNIGGTRAERNVALSRLLLEQIKGDSRFGYDLLYSVSTDENGNFNIPISDPINAGRVQQLLHSIIKSRINKQMIEGGPVVQVTNFGTSRELDIVFKDANNKRLDTLREWFAKQDFSEYGSPTYEEFAVMHRLKKAKEGTADYSTYHNIYLPLRKLVSERFQQEVASKQAGIMYIECYAPSTVFLQFADENGFVDLDKIPEEMREIIGFRIPTEFKYSMAPLRIVGLLPSEAGEGIMLPKDITTLSGSDFDVDKLYIIRPAVRFNKEKFRQFFEENSAMHYDNKAIWDYIYEHYKEVDDEIKREKDNYYLEQKALYGFTGTREEALEKAGKKAKKDWLEFPEAYFDRAVLELTDAGEISKYEKGKRVNVGEKRLSYKQAREEAKKDSSYYIKVTDEDTKDGRDNIIFDTIWAMLTSELAMDQIFTPGNFDEPKKYGYMAEAIRTHPELSYEEISQKYEEEGVDGLKDLILKSKNLVYNNVHLAFHKQNMVAGKLIGIFALNNVSHSVVSLIDLSPMVDDQGKIVRDINGNIKVWKPSIYVEIPVLVIEGGLIGGGEVSFDALEGKNGSRISNTLAAFLAASVDAVKDPVLNYMNINETTAGILTTMVRMGYDTELAMLFLTQPIIRKVVTRYNIENEGGFTTLLSLIDKVIQEINENDIDVTSLSVPEISKASLIKTLRKATPEENINLLRALALLDELSKTTSAIVSITKFNSVTAAAGPMLSNTMLMKQRIYNNLEKKELQTASMTEALNNPIIASFRRAEFIAVDRMFSGMMLQASHLFDKLVLDMQEIINGTMDDSMVNKLSDFYLAFMLASSDSPIFRTDTNNDPISEKRREYIYKKLPWEIKKLKKKSDNKFLNMLRVLPPDDAHEYYWLKINTRGMEGSVQDTVGLYWQELYQDNPEIAMALIEYNFWTSGLGFSPNSFANLIPVALKKAIPNYIQLLHPARVLNTEQLNRLKDLFIRNNYSDSKIVKKVYKFNEKAISRGNGYILIAPAEHKLVSKGGTPLSYIFYHGTLYRLVGTKGDHLKYIKVTTLGGKYGELIEINPQGEVDHIDLTPKSKKKDTGLKKTEKEVKVTLEDIDNFDVGTEDSSKTSYKDKMVAQIQWFILNKIPLEEQHERVSRLWGALKARSQDKAAPSRTLIRMFKDYDKEDYNKEAFDQMKNIGDILFTAVAGLKNVDNEKLDSIIKGVIDTKNDLNLCD